MKLAEKLPKDRLQKVILVALVALAGFLVTMRFYTWKQYSDWRSNKAEIAKLKHQIQEAERTAQSARENREECQRLSSFVQQQQAAMVSGDPFAWAVREISLLGEQHPVRIASMRPLGITPHGRKSGYDVFTVGLELTGMFDEIGALVRDIENKFPTAEVRLLEVIGSETESRERRANLNIALLMRSPSAGNQKQDQPT